jgi:hemolysin III
LGLAVLTPVAREAGPFHFYGTAVFGITAALVFGISAVYHFLHDGYELSPRLIELLEKFDQWAIYLFIAGTYTPFLLNVIASPWREILMVSVWAMALFGIFYTAFRDYLPRWAQSRIVYTMVFVLMGWTLLFRIGEVIEKTPPMALAFLLAGAAAYTIGAVVYITKKPKLFEGFFGFHELWHVFVTVGFICHFLMVGQFYF